MKRGRIKLNRSELRTVRVNLSFSASEIEQIDTDRKTCGRSIYIRNKALGLGRSIPAINTEAWREMSRAFGNLSTLAKHSVIGIADKREATELLNQIKSLLVAGINELIEDEEK